MCSNGKEKWQIRLDNREKSVNEKGVRIMILRANTIVLIVLVMFVFTGCSTHQQKNVTITDNEMLLQNCQNEKDIEEKIATYLQEKEGWSVTYRRVKNNRDDLYLILQFSLNGIPDIRIMIDTYKGSTEEQTDKVTSRKIRITATRDKLEDIGLFKDNKSQVLAQLNQWMMNHYLPGSMYINEKNDLVIKSYLIVGDDFPVYLEQVGKSVKHVIGGWVNVYKYLEEQQLYTKVATPQSIDM